MKFLYPILKPSGKKSKWLLLLLFIALIYLAETGHLSEVVAHLSSDKMTLKLGESSFTLYRAIKSLILVIALFWVASIFSDFGEKQIKRLMRGQKDANKSLVITAFQTLLYVIAILITLDIIGLDITTLAVFSGALGIGLGFGLQKVASNFISGLILLFEKSVEVGDLIELNDGVNGFVRHTGARYTLIETFENREIMIPNEDFITNKVTNWTFSNEKGRVDIVIGVSYGSDLDKAYKLILEAAKEHPRCSKETEPECYLTDFGDSSVNFELYFWVDDIITGRKRPRSDVLFTIWRKFKENNIEIPFPQRDVHIKNKGTLS